MAVRTGDGNSYLHLAEMLDAAEPVQQEVFECSSTTSAQNIHAT